MKTIILPGYSEHNRKWVMEVAEKIDVDHEVKPVLWDHWTDKSIGFSIEEKVEKVINLAGSDKINLIAKSIGTLVTALLISRIPQEIERVILCGIPLKDITPQQIIFYREALPTFPSEKIICFQNRNDPHGSYKEIDAFIRSINPAISLVEKLRNDHEYPYFGEFQGFLSQDGQI